MVPEPGSCRLLFLCADIGRGHPFYLDGMIHELKQLQPEGSWQCQRAIDMCGPAGRLAWKAVAELYTRGSSPGLWSGLYAKLRRNNDYNRERAVLRFFRSSMRDVVSRYGHSPIVVSHPLLVAALRPHPRVYYLHGEVVTPTEAVVLGAYRIFVPTPEAAVPFLAAGYDASSVLITGLCIEPELVTQAEQCRSSRLARLEQTVPLTGAFFSSGAEPAQHVDALVASAGSVIKSGGAAHVFAMQDGRLSRALQPLRQQAGQASNRFTVHLFQSRAELDRLTASNFGSFDYFVAPPHERANWALGLGLPMYIIGPDIGPFAPLNRHQLLEEGVAQPLGEASQLGARQNDPEAREQLTSMARRGGSYSILGFSEAARCLASDLAGVGR